MSVTNSMTKSKLLTLKEKTAYNCFAANITTVGCFETDNQIKSNQQLASALLAAHGIL